MELIKKILKDEQGYGMVELLIIISVLGGIAVAVGTKLKTNLAGSTSSTNSSSDNVSTNINSMINSWNQ